MDYKAAELETCQRHRYPFFHFFEPVQHNVDWGAGYLVAFAFR